MSMTLQPSAGVPDGSGPSKEENCSFGMAGEGDAEEQPEEESPTDDETVEPAPCHLKKQRQDLKPGKKLVPRPVVPKNAEEPASGSSRPGGLSAAAIEAKAALAEPSKRFAFKDYALLGLLKYILNT